MMKKKTILIAGGAGFIGSNVNKMLNDAGYETIVYDNLSRGSVRALTRGTFIEGDIGDARKLEEVMSNYKIDAVMHFAAWIDVGESVKDPAKYYQNNVVNTLVLLNAMVKPP
jgi:UDP-glucose 4-epimerase